jgi:hypothetical protein
MTSKPITTGSQTQAAAGPVTGSLDLSGLAKPSTLVLNITGLSAAAGTPRARIIVEDTVNAFTAAVPVAMVNIEGPIVPSAPVTYTFNQDHIPSLRIGTASAALRANVVLLEGTTPSITLDAELQN